MHDPHNITCECQWCSTPDIEIDHGSVMGVCTLIFRLNLFAGHCYVFFIYFNLFLFTDMFCILMHLRLRFLFLIFEYLFRLDKLAIY